MTLPHDRHAPDAAAGTAPTAEPTPNKTAEKRAAKPTFSEDGFERPQSEVGAAPTEAEAGGLLDPKFLQKLKALQVLSKKTFAGRFKGERRSKKRGTSIEFADFRNYVQGDDPRFIDWNTYGRLDRLFLKLYMEEEDLGIAMLLDSSKSMDWEKKFLWAKKIAAALGYIGLLNQDRVSIGSFASGMREHTRSMRGRGRAPRMIQFLEGLQADGGTNLTEAVRRHLILQRQPGLAVIISDFLDPAGYETALKMLQGHRWDVFVIQVLAETEKEPDLRGDLRLIDSESGGQLEVSISEAIIKRYKAAVDAYTEELRDFCAKRGMGYLLTDTGQDFEEVLLKYLRTAGLLR